MEEEVEASLDAIIEVREELLVSPSSGGNPTRRIAHFLQPTLQHCNRHPPPPREFLLPHSLFSATATTSNPSKKPADVRYNGWLQPHEEWKTWVELMRLKYETLWIKAGIDQAIKASTYQIHRNDELILELAQRWYSNTNTFIFPWGEATITLEDVKVCGGYSVLGEPVFSPLETQEQKEAEAKLFAVRRIFNNSAKKRVDHAPWMMYFMNYESQVEHEGFLTLWLSRFVLPANSQNSILKSVFPTAIHLARGTTLALAPAVLASIYRDLRLLNNCVTSKTVMNNGVTLWAPFQLVQIWALERFPKLQPRPFVVGHGKPVMARWHKVKMLKNNDFKLTLDSADAGNCFLWRPYENSPPLKLYNEKDMWECVNPSIEVELLSFGRCLRVSELVGLGCSEQYLPHRVALQFGMDQDIPGMVGRINKDYLVSWRNYSKPIVDTLLWTALCAYKFQPSVTSSYYDWWKQSKQGKVEEDPRKAQDHYVVSISSSEHLSQDSCGEVKGEVSCGPLPGFPSKSKRRQVRDADQDDVLTTAEVLIRSTKVRCFGDEVAGSCKALSTPHSGVLPSSIIDDETDGSMTGGVYSLAKSKDVLEGSKRNMEDAQTEDVVGLARRAKEDDNNEAKMKSTFYKNGVNDEEGEYSSSCTFEDIASDLENRIWELERMVVKLKAEKFGPKLKYIGAKANLSVL